VLSTRYLWLCPLDATSFHTSNWHTLVSQVLSRFFKVTFSESPSVRLVTRLQDVSPAMSSSVLDGARALSAFSVGSPNGADGGPETHISDGGGEVSLALSSQTLSRKLNRNDVSDSSDAMATEGVKELAVPMDGRSNNMPWIGCPPWDDLVAAAATVDRCTADNPSAAATQSANPAIGPNAQPPL
jgi:hypothetical protein